MRQQAAFENYVEDAKTILPSHLLSFLVGSRAVIDSDLLNPAAQPGKFCDQFCIYPKFILGNNHSWKERGSKCFMPGLYVSQVQTGKKVREESKELVNRFLPEIPELLRLCAGKTRTQHDIRLVSQNRSQKTRVFARVILEVGILNHDHAPCSGSETRAKSSAFSKISRLANNSVDRRRNFLQNRVRLIIGTIVNDYYFHLLDWRLSNRFDDFLDCLVLVEAGDDD